MMTLQPRRRRRRSSLKSKDIAQSNRRIYDPRRWHKRSSSNNVHMSGQPPAGWVLVWAGRFKRWRRRWFVAHPPGLLLHYKSSDQIGQPGCISLVVSILLLLFSIKLVVSVWVLDSQLNDICMNREQQLCLHQARSGNLRLSRAP
jgi:hypothetical protein